MKLTRFRPDVCSTERGAFRKFGPIVAAIAVSTLLTVPLVGNAEGAKKYTCSARVKQGSMKRLTSARMSRGRLTSLKVNMLSGEKGRYIQVSFPDKYMRALTMASSELSEATRSAFISDKILASLEAARDALGSDKSANFQCASPVPPAPIAAPVPPRFVSGKGTEQDPFVIEVPVPVEEKSLMGAELYSTVGDPSYIVSGTVRAYFSCRFVGSKSRMRVTSSERLSQAIAVTLAGRVKKYLSDSGAGNVDASSTLKSAARSVVRSAASRRDAIGLYAVPATSATEAAEEPGADAGSREQPDAGTDAQPAKRRRVIRFE